MLDFLRKLAAGPDAAPTLDAPTALAALLVEVARSDDHYDEPERRLVERALAGLLDLGPWEAAAKRAEGEAAQAAAADLVRFTRVVKAALDEAERVAFVEALWEIVLADGARDPHEDALMRKLAPLVAVTDRESAEARRRVAARLGGS